MLVSERLHYWPIGQGLFTHVDVRIGSALFRMVYDCGAGPEAGAANAEHAIESLAGRKLDLLVISHFHWDHISHVPQLLAKTGGAKRAWAPYLAPKARVLYAVALAGAAEVAGVPFDRYQQHLSLAIRPVEWLTARGVEVVELIGGPGEEPGGEGGPPSPDAPERPPRRSDQEEPEEDVEGEDWPRLRLGPLRPWPGAFRAGSEFRARWSVVEAKGRRLRGGGGPLLALATWCKPLPPGQVDQFRAFVQDVLGLELPRLGDGDLTESDERRLAEWLGENLGRADFREQLRGAYHQLQKQQDLNATSLCLCAQALRAWTRWVDFRAPYVLRPCGPIFPWPVGRGFRYVLEYMTLMEKTFRMFKSRYHCPWPEIFGEEASRDFPKGIGKWSPTVLWLGDCPGPTLLRMLKDATSELTKRIASTWFWQVPHHGSKSGWCRQLYHELMPAYGVVSCGLSNRYGHPSTKVVSETGAAIITEAFAAPLVACIQWDTP